MANIRLYIEQSLEISSQVIDLTDQQHHYLFNVMRSRDGDTIRVFNGIDGEWLAIISTFVDGHIAGAKLEPGSLIKSQTKTSIDARLENSNTNKLIYSKTNKLNKKKQKYNLILRDKIKAMPPASSKKTYLVFAPFKAYSPSFVVQKATELGVDQIIPIQTQRTVIKSVNHEKLKISAIEAAEQSERLTLPIVAAKFQTYTQIIAELKKTERSKIVLFFDTDSPEAISVQNLFQWIDSAKNKIAESILEFKQISYYIFIGPEGGFSQEERDEMMKFSFESNSVSKSCIVSLGELVLRAETAFIAALSLIQFVK